MSVELTGNAVEVAGVVVIVGGALVVGVWAVLRWVRAGGREAYTYMRQQLGRAILLGLELLVAADIIRTVAERPTPSTVAVLAGIVAIRTFLSWSLEVELEGRWPWQRAKAERAESRDSRGEQSPQPGAQA